MLRKNYIVPDLGHELRGKTRRGLLKVLRHGAMTDKE